MAEGIRFTCNNCGVTIEAWSDGNPYYLTKRGKKKYAYHPDHDALKKCIGNDSPYLCLECGEQFMNDSNAPTEACPKCGSKKICDTYRLQRRRCPYCKNGSYSLDPDYRVIS